MSALLTIRNEGPRKLWKAMFGRFQTPGSFTCQSTRLPSAFCCLPASKSMSLTCRRPERSRFRASALVEAIETQTSIALTDQCSGEPLADCHSSRSSGYAFLNSTADLSPNDFQRLLES